MISKKKKKRFLLKTKSNKKAQPVITLNSYSTHTNYLKPNNLNLSKVSPKANSNINIKKSLSIANTNIYNIKDTIKSMLQTQQSSILHKQHIALLVSSFIFGMPIVANAQYMNLKNFFYRDYLDLGQNRGQFQPGNTNVTLQSLKNPGVSVTLPFEIAV